MKVVKVVKELGIGISLLTSMSTGTFGGVLAIVGLVAAAVTAIAGAFAQAMEPVDYTKALTALGDHIGSVQSLKAEYERLADKQHKTTSESARMDSILGQLAGSSLALRDALTSATGEYKNQAEAVKELNTYLTEMIARKNAIERADAAQAFRDVGPMRDARRQVEDARTLVGLWEAYQEFLNDNAYKNKDEASFDVFMALKQQQALGNQALEEAQRWSTIRDKYADLASSVTNLFGYRSIDFDTQMQLIGQEAQGKMGAAMDALDAAWSVYKEH